MIALHTIFLIANLVGWAVIFLATLIVNVEESKRKRRDFFGQLGIYISMISAIFAILSWMAILI